VMARARTLQSLQRERAEVSCRERTIGARVAATIAQLVVAGLLASAPAAQAEEQWMTLAGLRVAVWSDSAPT